MPELLPSYRAIRDLLQEHQRRELDDFATLTVNEMDQHREGDGGEAGEECGSEEGQGRRVRSEGGEWGVRGEELGKTHNSDSTNPSEAFSRREIPEQGLVDRLRGVEQRIV